jgi:hypothetical protein
MVAIAACGVKDNAAVGCWAQSLAGIHYLTHTQFFLLFVCGLIFMSSAETTGWKPVGHYRRGRLSSIPAGTAVLLIIWG